MYLELMAGGRHVETEEPGRIVFTDLYRLDPPLIRCLTHRMGAFAAEPCPCASPLPLIKVVEKVEE